MSLTMLPGRMSYLEAEVGGEVPLDEPHSGLLLPGSDPPCP
jgi:hypothetical protein